MPRENENVTHVRISQKDLDILNSLKVGKDTNRKILSKLIADYDDYGIRRRIVTLISEIQTYLDQNVHEDLHFCLNQFMSIIMIVEKTKNRMAKADICELLLNNLDEIVNEKIDELLKKKYPDIKK